MNTFFSGTDWSQLNDPFEVVNIAGNDTWKFNGQFLFLG